jgi:hypothetical protein
MNSTQHTVLDVAPGILTCMVRRLPEMVREWSAEQRAVVDLMAVSGFVHILANPLKAPQRVFCVCSPARTHVRSPMALIRIWHHALTLMQRAGVTHALLSAPHQDESLQELFRLLSTNGYGMTAVFVCASDPVYTASCESLRRLWAEQLITCVIVMRHSLPISWAAHLAKRSMQTGMMIMTHPFFVRHRLHPVIDWNRETQPQIPPEFLQTTLLLHHQAVKAVALELIPAIPMVSDIPQIDTFSPCTSVDHLPADCHRGCHVTGCTDYCISWGMTKLDSWQRDQLYDVLNLSGSQMDLKAQYDAGLGAMKTLMGAAVRDPVHAESLPSEGVGSFAVARVPGRVYLPGGLRDHRGGEGPVGQKHTSPAMARCTASIQLALRPVGVAHPGTGMGAESVLCVRRGHQLRATREPIGVR